ncbi:PIG-L deacetylase family protein, partial [Nocardia noduli]|uniref:PIG-L deacetylase family protein n=1 Tax=Nocardia noduli TaxID=2815722 RepID=UPI001C23C62A
MSGRRFAECEISDPGTPLHVWQPWVRRLPTVDPAEFATAPLQIIAPHPDDEVLGVGALAAYLTDADVSVSIIAVTDGEASLPGS